jgi:murein DD-endopeptidase MepM/ murein hydrolase activator NlpD
MKGGKSSNQFYGSASFIRPVDGWISSSFGQRFHPIFKRWIKHNGMDFAAPSGHKIRAADSGVVIVAGEKPQYRGYGKVTVIDHGLRKDGKRIATVYAHQSRILVHEGQMVKQGMEIGWVGSTGYSTGPHLHFEVRENGAPVDPARYIRR